jgi:hypothetical protein
MRSRLPAHYVLELRDLLDRVIVRLDSEKILSSEKSEFMELAQRLRKHTLMLMHELEG